MLQRACLTAVALVAVTSCVEEPIGEPVIEDTTLLASSWPTQRYTIRSRLWKDLDVAVTRVHRFTCVEGWTYTEDYQLRYPVCVAPLPGHCVDAYRITHRCIDGAFQVVSNVLVSHVCDYDYDGSSCDPIELPY